MSAQKFAIEWMDGGREPKNPPDKRYPKGIDLDVSSGRKFCQTQLPYPAKRCGYFIVECRKCGVRIALTTAGRADDPRSVKLPCKETPQTRH